MKWYTLLETWAPENDTLSGGTSSYRKCFGVQRVMLGDRYLFCRSVSVYFVFVLFRSPDTTTATSRVSKRAQAASGRISICWYLCSLYCRMKRAGSVQNNPKIMWPILALVLVIELSSQQGWFGPSVFPRWLWGHFGRFLPNRVF